MSRAADPSELPFIKMHGAGNDYVFIDAFRSKVPQDLSAAAVRFSDRNRSVGSDGLVIIEPAGNVSATAALRMFNADGSEGLMCGNAVRCAALWMALRHSAPDSQLIRMGNRLVPATIIAIDRLRRHAMVTIDPGPVRVSDHDVPIIDCRLPDGSQARIRTADVGNPHAVCLTATLTDALVRTIGPRIEHHSMFPNRTNVEFVRCDASDELTVRVWERGSGETLACGSGACAAVAAACAAGRCRYDREIRVHLPGGTLFVRAGSDGNVLLTGPAEVSFTGVIRSATD